MLLQGVCDEDGLQPHVCFCGPGKPKANNNNTCMLVLVSMGPMQMTKQLEPGLGSSNKGWTKKEKAEFKKVLVKTHGKIYKPHSQKPKV